MKCFNFLTVLLAIRLSNGLQFPNCQLKFSFANVCHRYIFENDCVPWNLTHCQKPKTTFADSKCPRYRCVSFKDENIEYID